MPVSTHYCCHWSASSYVKKAALQLTELIHKFIIFYILTKTVVGCT